MPQRVQQFYLDVKVGPLSVVGKVAVEGPFYGGLPGKPENETATRMTVSLAERIERAVHTAIANFRHDFGVRDDGA